MKRRKFMQLAISQTGVLAAAAAPMKGSKKPRVVVVGAGVFGVWTAWHALQAGAQVTLVDAYAPGHSRASSGGETRQITEAQQNPVYATLASRSMKQWHHWEKQWNTPLFVPTGRLVMASHGGSGKALAAHERMEVAGLPSEVLTSDQLKARWPQIHMDGVTTGVFMPTVGLLKARHAVAEVASRFREAGGTLRIAKVLPSTLKSGELRHVQAADGSTLEGDVFIFACGPWLPKLFPDVLATKLRPVRRDVFFVGPPAGDSRFQPPHLPSWTYRGASDEPAYNTFYGFPSVDGRGMKICPVNEANTIDPDRDSRLVNPYQAKRVREFLAYRFPQLADQPFIETRVCQVTDSIGGNFLVDRHPGLRNVWLLGGGAGHGFKHGPALGKYVAERVLELGQEPDFDQLFKLNPGRLQAFNRD